MTRSEHLAWCKQRALEYLDRGDIRNAVASMASDLQKHEDFQGNGVAIALQMGLYLKTPDSVRRWIEGFN